VKRTLQENHTAKANGVAETQIKLVETAYTVSGNEARRRTHYNTEKNKENDKMETNQRCQNTMYSPDEGGKARESTDSGAYDCRQKFTNEKTACTHAGKSVPIGYENCMYACRQK